MPQKLCCRVGQVVHHGGQVYSLELYPERPVPRFQPGQFLHLAIDPYQPGDYWPESRVFSIASSPDHREQITITYSVVGAFTKRMEKEVCPDKNVWIKLPYGEFVIKGENEVALVAGGTGITAFTSFLDGLPGNRQLKVSLFYGVRTRDLLIFHPLIEKLKNESELFSAWYFIEEGETEGSKGFIPGRLSVSSIMPHVINPGSTDFYLSGPPGMLKQLCADFKFEGLLPGQIKIDAWE